MSDDLKVTHGGVAPTSGDVAEWSQAWTFPDPLPASYKAPPNAPALQSYPPPPDRNGYVLAIAKAAIRNALAIIDKGSPAGRLFEGIGSDEEAEWLLTECRALRDELANRRRGNL